MREPLRRAFASPKLIPVLTLLAIASLVMSTYVVVRFAQSQSQREADRVASDLGACQRVNVLRGQMIGLGDGVDEALNGVIGVVLDRVSPETAAELRSELAPTLERLHAVVESIELVECAEVIPGLTTTTTEEP